MYVYRHDKCGLRLLDIGFACTEVTGKLADIVVKCSRCSRLIKRNVTVRLRIDELRWASLRGDYQPVLCQNIGCLHRVCDLAIPYRRCYDDDSADIVIACPRCKCLTRLQLQGIAKVWK